MKWSSPDCGHDASLTFGTSGSVGCLSAHQSFAPVSADFAVVGYCGKGIPLCIQRVRAARSRGDRCVQSGGMARPFSTGQPNQITTKSDRQTLFRSIGMSNEIDGNAVNGNAIIIPVYHGC